MNTEIITHLGPLAPLAGIWEGNTGIDISPSHTGPVKTAFRERIAFDPLGPVTNGPQVLYGLRYSTVAWPIGADAPFHEEVGYWLWDQTAYQVMRCFIIPRGVTVNAGGHVQPNATHFELAAEVGSETYGVTSNPFLDEAFKTMRYELRVTIDADDRFSYAEDTQLKIPALDDLFHHTDQNTLSKVSFQ